MVKVLGVVSYVKKSDDMLMILRDNHPLKNYKSVPGGGLEKNESKEEAAVREIKEETNLDAEFMGWLGDLTFQDDYRPSIIYNVGVAECEVKPGELKPGPDVRDAFWLKSSKIYNKENKELDPMVAYPVKEFYKKMIESHGTHSRMPISLNLVDQYKGWVNPTLTEKVSQHV